MVSTPALPQDSLVRETNRPYFYREAYLPGATAQNHASNLLLLPNGDVLCAWFGGSMEGKPDISIYLSRLRSGEQSWSEAIRMTHDNTRSEQNPVLFCTPTGDLWLLYTSQHAGNQDSAIVKRRISKDDGITWGKEEVLFPDSGIFIRQPVIVLDDGAWVIPVFKCRVEPGERWLGNNDISCIRVSRDEGQTWTESVIPESTGCVHMEIQRLKDCSYLGLFRSRWADHIYLATSPDGLSWSPPQPTILPNPNAGICFDVLPSGRVVVVYNHSSKLDATGRRQGLYDDIADGVDERRDQSSTQDGRESFWGAPRAPLCVAWSDDSGKTWERRVLEDGDGYCMTNNSEKKLNRELSYPSMVLDEGKIHIACTFWRQRIKYVQLSDDFFSA
ncbi:glycosyl hydrolase [Aspergillus flavus]|nr:glycosyl hydrolase [Aspergillus flavus]RAQ73246.1 glycosyl hydrolase [Aspergillus flavus]